ncbi:hypothetical protein M413DRAFT_181993 [Hebeloma cylindrosporum]|uniref:HTH APSES-type domain-containing protein n=1 Tax=Hebeloma cylindrosporum TaxID=76867 RepID=A0A0C3BSV3_HEBCY|nr:hypothetical protein M413DRAFT_181993 [Hebeloma cylindrosporum h7]
MVARPPLPVRFANPNIKEHLAAPHLPPVKYQILSCQGRDILVGRLKIETPTDTGHAFILRRFDTGAVSLTTMFRAAFPKATDMEEKQEIQWVKDTYDLSGNNGSVKEPQITRLAGTWVSPQVALELGKAYALGAIINAVVEACPDPNGNYRRSGKAAAAGGSTNTPKAAAAAITTTVSTQTTTPAVSKPPSAAKSLPTPSPTAAVPPAKRRKESSPVPTPQSSKPPSRASPAPSKVAPPRRSTRTKSPAPRSAAAAIAPLTSASRTPKAPRSSAKKEVVASTSLTPGGSDLTAVDEEGELVNDGVAGAELREQDIEEQKKLIEDLKQKRNQEEGQMDTEESASSKKRDREEGDKPLQFQFKEPETEERAIATNSRVGRFHLEPRAKSFAWGVAAFAVGMGAVSFLPSFF